MFTEIESERLESESFWVFKDVKAVISGGGMGGAAETKEVVQSFKQPGLGAHNSLKRLTPLNVQPGFKLIFFAGCVIQHTVIGQLLGL